MPAYRVYLRPEGISDIPRHTRMIFEIEAENKKEAADFLENKALIKGISKELKKIDDEIKGQMRIFHIQLTETEPLMLATIGLGSFKSGK